MLLQKNPISFVEIYSDTFLRMPLTSFSTTNPFKLLEETKRDTEKENQGGKRKRWRILRSHSPPSSPSSVRKTNRQKNLILRICFFFFWACFFGFFSPSLQEEIDVITIKNVGAFDDHDGNALLPVCFSHH